ncbi:DNA polymerase beta domain protein region [Desulfamplus magnetovallimortis]|uniref:DNA polymerase beta domain protein region n=1 Tax=Desulfamplus magnetovallimortis TaxID=1246637 RepID=A0A1W1HBS2_9BACT|nr:nucleotidyltransferase domain-containing protein [Desulfamplus magnetovallimortis]SLM29886.1 DNA polymerase beta domain protein region [Desulfamplus magnetovallimortis]
MKREQIVQILRQYKHEVEKEHGISKMGIFGSVARNESTQASDIDVFVEMIKPDLFALAGIKNDLESKFKKSVDVVLYGKYTNNFLKQRIDRDALYV